MPHPEWEAHKKLDHHVAISDSSFPVAPYTRRAPSPPVLTIPARPRGLEDKAPCLSPSYQHIDASLLPPHDAMIITRDAVHEANDSTILWRYEQRREAQRVLDFLYLGPISAIRDHASLEREGITMLVVAQDCRKGSERLVSVDKAAEALNLEVRYIDVSSSNNLVNVFPDVIRAINGHLLAMHHAKAMDHTLRQGKALIACESGNNRSAAIAAAYIMAIFGQAWIPVCQFISVQRFCTVFDDDTKLKLLTWQGILEARSQVSAALSGGPTPVPLPVPNGSHAGKRRTEDSDDDRFTGRETFVPFADDDSLQHSIPVESDLRPGQQEGNEVEMSS